MNEMIPSKPYDRFANKLMLLFALVALIAVALGCGESKPRVWQKAKPLAGKLDHPSALTVDGTNLYFVTGGTVASKNEGTNNVMKMPVGGGPAEIVFKGGDLIIDPHSIATDDDSVYFSASGLRKIAKSGGEAKLLTEAFSASEMIVDKDSVFWLPFVGQGMPAAPIYRVSKNGGAPTALTGPREGANGLSSDAENIYWSERSGIYRVAKAGGQVETVHTASADRPVGELRADGDAFYFLEGTSARSLFRIPRSGGPPVAIAKNVSDFWLGGDRIVFSRYTDSFSVAIFRIAKTGGEATELDRDGHLADLVLSGQTVLVADINTIYALN